MALNPTDRIASNPIMMIVMAVVAIGVIWFLVSIFIAPTATVTTPTSVERTIPIPVAPAPSTPTPSPTPTPK